MLSTNYQVVSVWHETSYQRLPTPMNRSSEATAFHEHGCRVCSESGARTLGRPFPWTTTTGRWDARPAPPIHLHLHLATISSRRLTSMIDGVTAPAGERAGQPANPSGIRLYTNQRASRTASEWLPPSGQLDWSSPSNRRFIVQSSRQYNIHQYTAAAAVGGKNLLKCLANEGLGAHVTDLLWSTSASSLLQRK